MYPYWVRVRGHRSLLIWMSTGKGDRFKLTEQGSLIAARTRKELELVLGSEASHVRWHEQASLDFDAFWLEVNGLRVKCATTPKTCNLILEGWNFLDDMLATLAKTALLKRSRSARVKKIYDKLFFGSNLPAVTPKGQSYNPMWTGDEIRQLRAILKALWNGVTFPRERQRR